MQDEHESIYDWAAKRAGGSITVYGKTRQGNIRRVTNVDRIEPMETDFGMRPIAICKDGAKYILAF